MQVFVTGATGYVGFAVAAALRRAGYRVWGLARSEAKARRLTRHEIEPVIGDLADPKTYLEVASDCALLVHTAFDYAAAGVAKNKTAIDTLLDAGRRRAGPGRPTRRRVRRPRRSDRPVVRRTEYGEAAVGRGGWSKPVTDGSY